MKFPFSTALLLTSALLPFAESSDLLRGGRSLQDTMPSKEKESGDGIPTVQTKRKGSDDSIVSEPSKGKNSKAPKISKAKISKSPSKEKGSDDSIVSEPSKGKNSKAPKISKAKISKAPSCKTIDDDENSNLNFRFNKFTVPSGVNLPTRLTAKHYPIRDCIYQNLKKTDAVSVINQSDYEVDMDVRNLINCVGGLPSYPMNDVNAPYWEELRHVIKVQDRRINDTNNVFFPLAKIWEGSDLGQIAKYVHNEYPGIIQSGFLAELLTKKYGEVNIDFDVIPYRSNEMFLRRDFMVANISTWAMSTVGPYNFAAKWHAGRARPEEVVWAIKRGRLSEGVPQDIKDAVDLMNINAATEFTAYLEGSPNHPSWPAMHSAIASVSFWLSVVLDLNDEQLCQARLTDYGISYARIVAGVHYPSDILTGMNLAQEVLAKKMADFLSEKYGSDKAKIEAKIAANRFDWNTFDPENPCPFMTMN